MQKRTQNNYYRLLCFSLCACAKIRTIETLNCRLLPLEHFIFLLLLFLKDERRSNYFKIKKWLRRILARFRPSDMGGIAHPFCRGRQSAHYIWTPRLELCRNRTLRINRNWWWRKWGALAHLRISADTLTSQLRWPI